VVGCRGLVYYVLVGGGWLGVEALYTCQARGGARCVLVHPSKSAVCLRDVELIIINK
jgi:hypothetical protein